jgi:hypothetical protein
VELRIVVEKVDARKQLRRGPVGPSANLDRPDDDSGDREQEHWPMPEHLSDGRQQVSVLAIGVELAGETRLNGPVVREQLQRPSDL